MCNKRFSVLFMVLCVLLSACSAAPTATVDPTPTVKPIPTFAALPDLSVVYIARHPEAPDYSSINSDPSIPKYDPNSTDPWQIDFRSANLTQLDLSKSKDDLLYATFDSKTQWPSADKMPTDFDWQKIMEDGRNPGLGVRALHQKGVTGRGIGIAIIDLPLLVEHQEYASRLRYYEELNISSSIEAQMHGPAVAAIAVGKTVGVAPDADLYYIATWPGNFDGQGGFDHDFRYTAQAVRRILEINAQLPAERKIRVISISVEWDKSKKGYDDINAAVNEAKVAGVFVVSCSLEETYGLVFHGLGRNPLADPDQFNAYEPGLWWSKDFYKTGKLASGLLVPMDARTTASPTGTEDYVYYRNGGFSWVVPYIAGMYALAAQARPDVTPEQFWKLAMETGQTIQVEHEGKSYSLGPILDAQALIAALQK
jgi:hypothetical protein